MIWQSEGMAFLTAAVLRPAVLVALAWLVLRAFRVRHPASQHMYLPYPKTNRASRRRCENGSRRRWPMLDVRVATL